MLDEIIKEAEEANLWTFIFLSASGYLIFSLVQGWEAQMPQIDTHRAGQNDC